MIALQPSNPAHAENIIHAKMSTTPNFENIPSYALKIVKKAESVRLACVRFLQCDYEAMMNADYRLSVAHSYQPSEVAELQKKLDHHSASFAESMRQYELTYEHRCPIKERE